MVPYSTPRAALCDTTRGAPEPPPHHEGLVDRVAELEDVVADSQVVLQAEGLQHHAVPHREGQSQLLAGGRPCGVPPSGKPTPSSRVPATPRPCPSRAPPTAQGSTSQEAQPPLSGPAHPGNRSPMEEAPPTHSGPTPGGHPLPPLWRKPIPPKIPPARSRKPHPIPAPPNPDGPTLKEKAPHQNHHS